MPAAPRADPYVRNYLIRLLPWVQRSRYNISTSRSRLQRCLADPGTVSGARAWRAAFPLSDPLSSTDSAAGVPGLFVRFAGTMGSSDFPRACMPAVPPAAFSGRSSVPWHVGNPWDLPVLALEVFTHAQVLRLRRVVQPLANNATTHVAFPTTSQGRHAKGMISELHSWPACTPCQCSTHDVTIVSV